MAEQPYIHLGFFLWNKRKQKEQTVDDVATFLGIEPAAYRHIEGGEICPDSKQFIALAELYKVPLSTLKKLGAFQTRKRIQKTDSPLEKARLYSDKLSEDINAVKDAYQGISGHELNKNQSNIFSQLKKDLYEMVIPPFLPMAALVPLQAVLRKDKQAKYLHEVPGLILDDESLASFLARDPQWGPILFFIGNLLFLKNNPAKSVLDCMNRLTLAQFNLAAHMISEKGGMYTLEQEIPYLTKEAEFATLGSIMVDELEPYLPKDVNVTHLKMAILLQISGTYILHTILQPSLKERGEEALAGEPGVYVGLDEDLFNLILVHLHPVISAMYATNLNFPKEVQEILLNRRAKSSAEVSPACAILKMVNYFVDNDFPVLPEEELNARMQRDYPNVNISPSSLFLINSKLKKLKAYLIQKSSIVAEQNKVVENYVSDRMEKNKGKLRVVSYHNEYTDNRFNKGFLRAIAKAAQMLLDEHREYMGSLQEKENLPAFQQRMGNIQVLMSYILNQDLQSLAQKFGVSSDEIEKCLKAYTSNS